MNRSLWTKVGLGVAVILVIVIWRQCAFKTVGTSDSRIGYPAPMFSLPTADGSREVALTDFTGEPVFLDFWSLTCPPCMDEMRHLRALHRKHEGKLNILSINIDPSSSQRKAKVEELIHKFELDFPVLLDDGPVQSDYDIEIMPTIFLVDDEGRIVRVFRGLTDQTVLDEAWRQVAR